MAGEANLDPQVAIRAAVPKEAARRMPERPRPGQAPGESRRQEQELREAISKRGMGEKPAEDLQSVLETRDNTSGDAQEEARLANFGTDINPTTHRREIPPASQPLADQAKRFDSLTAEIVQKNGNIDLRSPDYDQFIGNQIEDLLNAAGMSDVPRSLRFQLDKELLRDPGFIRELARGHADNLAKRVPGLEEFMQAKNAKDKADSEVVAAEARWGEAVGEIRVLQTENESLNTPNGDKNKRLRELSEDRDLDQEKSDSSIELRAKQRSFEKLVKDREKLIERKNGINPPHDIDDQLTAIESRIETAKNERNTAKTKTDEVASAIRERDGILHEQQALPERLREAEQALKEATEAFNSADAERQKSGSEYASAFHKREAELRSWVAEKGNLVRDAWQRVIDERVRVANEAHSAEMDEKVNKAKDEKEKKLAENRRKRFFSKDNRGKTKINNDAIREDMSKLTDIDINGAEELYIQDLRGAGYGEEEINQMKADKENWNAALGVRAQDVAAAYIRNNGTFRNRNRLTEAEASFIESQPWGQGLIQKAKESAQGQKVDKMLKDAGIKDGILDKRISKKTLLELLLGGIIAAGAVTVGAAGLSVTGNL